MQYLEIDLKRNSHVTEIITQGALGKNAWVETYTVSYGHSGDIWKQYKENGSLKVKKWIMLYPTRFFPHWKWKKEKWKKGIVYSYICFFILMLWEFPALQNVRKRIEQFSSYRSLSLQKFFLREWELCWQYLFCQSVIWTIYIFICRFSKEITTARLLWLANLWNAFWRDLSGSIQSVGLFMFVCEWTYEVGVCIIQLKVSIAKQHEMKLWRRVAKKCLVFLKYFDSHI